MPDQTLTLGERDTAGIDLDSYFADPDGDVTVEGTVRAVTPLSSARVIAYVDAHRLGEQALGDVPAGGMRRFAIRGTATVSSTSECHVESLAGQRSMSVNASVSFR